jgi:phosphoribosylformylglycinamidine cyclo-ligase
MAKKVTYKQAGVDIDTGDALVENLKKINPGIGGFGGLMALPRGIRNPRLVMSTDGVGTKLLVAEELKIFDTLGIDLVAMVVNDIIALGAKPIAFLDYYATDKLRLKDATDLISGIVEGCRQSGCDLVGGETAELPGLYPKNGFDLAGFGVGVVDNSKVVDGNKVAEGDVVIGLASTGIHSNGYSLARKVLLERSNPKGRERKEVLREMLTPTAIYVKPILKLMSKVKVNAIAHITGGGLPGNLVRVLPKGVKAVLDPESWDVPQIFQKIEEQGPVAREEMFKVFNMGIGMCIVVNPRHAMEAVKMLRRAKVQSWEIGVIQKGRRTVKIDGV